MKKQISSLIIGFFLSACSAQTVQDTNAPDAEKANTDISNVQTGGSHASCHTRAYEEIGGPISLIDQNGERRTEADFEGKSALVFFGFTYCPDICPTTLVKINRALKRLDREDSPIPIFITVDSERDTPEEISRYLSLEAYPKNTIGLTGTETEIRAAADAFIADYTRVPLPDSASEYTMDHTSLIYFMDENWKLATFFDYTATDEHIANCIRELL